MTALGVIWSSFRTDLLQHLRHPAIWLVVLLAPIAAHYMIPTPGAAYSVLVINGAAPVLSADVIGLELGVVVATLLSPIAYVFLRSGATRTRPSAVTDVLGHSRMAEMMGRWLADTALLWIMLAVLVAAGIILGVVRLGIGAAKPLDTVLVAGVIAAPALSMIAAVRTLLTSRPMLHGWFGDLLFFIIWMTGLTVSAATGALADAGVLNPFVDVFGYVYPIIASADFPIDAISIGFTEGVEETLSFDARSGSLSSAYLVSRGLWLLAAVALVLFAGLTYSPVRPSFKSAQKQAKTRAAQTAVTAMAVDLKPVAVPSASLFATIISEARLLFSSRMWLALAVIGAGLGAAFDYRMIAGPALWLLMIFPLCAGAARWQDLSVRTFLTTSPVSPLARMGAFIVAGAVWMAILHLPALGRAVLSGDVTDLRDMGLITIGVPVLAALLAFASRGQTAPRMALLVVWYSYLSTAA